MMSDKVTQCEAESCACVRMRVVRVCTYQQLVSCKRYTWAASLCDNAHTRVHRHAWQIDERQARTYNARTQSMRGGSAAREQSTCRPQC